MRRPLPVVLFATGLFAAGVPHVDITSGPIRATVYLPDAENGYYRGTRFDWSGVIASLSYRGHTYFGPWFDNYNPKIRDAIRGPAEEFLSNQTWSETKPGDPFMKIGVGFIRKPSAAPFDLTRTYDIVEPGKWTVKTKPDEVEFVQELNDAATGYGCSYHKTVRLVSDKGDLVLEHTLENTGQKPIISSVRDDNFFVLDDQAPGPDFSIRFPFTLKAGGATLRNALELHGDTLAFIRTLRKAETVYTRLTGFGDNSGDYNIRIEDSKTGAGVRITSDQPLAALEFFATSTAVCPQPFVSIRVDPGGMVKWQITYHFYALPIPEGG